jgi:hypothetical protein
LLSGRGCLRLLFHGAYPSVLPFLDSKVAVERKLRAKTETEWRPGCQAFSLFQLPVDTCRPGASQQKQLVMPLAQGWLKAGAQGTLTDTRAAREDREHQQSSVPRSPRWPQRRVPTGWKKEWSLRGTDEAKLQVVLSLAGLSPTCPPSRPPQQHPSRAPRSMSHTPAGRAPPRQAGCPYGVQICGRGHPSPGKANPDMQLPALSSLWDQLRLQGHLGEASCPAHTRSLCSWPLVAEAHGVQGISQSARVGVCEGGLV